MDSRPNQHSQGVNRSKQTAEEVPTNPAAPTPSPILSRRYNQIKLALLLLVLLTASGGAAAFMFSHIRDPEHVHTSPVDWVWISAYVGGTVMLLILARVLTRQYLECRLLKALANRGLDIDPADGWHFVALIHPAVRAQPLDTAYAAGFLRIVRVPESLGPSRPGEAESRMIIESDVERWDIRASDVLEVRRQSPAAFSPVVIRFQTEKRAAPRELMLAGRGESLLIGVAGSTERLFRLLVASLTPEAAREKRTWWGGKETSETAESEFSPRTFTARGFSSKRLELVCDDTGVRFRRGDKVVWDARWEDILGVRTSQYGHLYLLTNEKKHVINGSLFSTREIARTVNAGLKRLQESQRAQDRIRFFVPSYELQYLRRGIWGFGAFACVWLGVPVVLIAPGIAKYARLFHGASDNPYAVLFRAALILLAGMVFPVFLALAHTSFRLWRLLRSCRAAAVVELARDHVTVTSTGGRSMTVPFRSIREIAKNRMWSELRTFDGKRIRICSLLGRQPFFDEELSRRLRVAGMTVREIEQRFNRAALVLRCAIYAGLIGLWLGLVIHEIRKLGMDWHDVFRH